MQCAKCHHENRNEARFCEDCGAKLALVCPECGSELRPNANFCDKCGTRLGESSSSKDETAIPKLEDMHDQLQSIIPDELAQKYMTAEEHISGENRPITALFADISGFTPLSATQSSEAIFQLVQDCFKELVGVVARYKGSISGFRGDGLLALFGAPILHENDAERAILAAMNMRNIMQERDLKVSIGINTAMMTVGEIQTQLHREYTAYGTDINLAKRLQEAAEPGQILVGSGTHRLTRRAFDFEAPPPLNVKGFPDTVTAYSVMQLKPVAEKLRGIEGLEARMIGREHEFVALMDCVDTLTDEGRGQIATIVGEAGIGKSRLVRELKEYTADKNIHWLEGRCISIGQTVSFWPFVDMIRTYLDISGEDSEKEIISKLVDKMNELFGQQAEGIIPYVGYMLSLKLPEKYQEQIRYAAPEQIRHQALLRTRDVFIALARMQPLVMVLEDLHWADDMSLDLLWVLMDEVMAVPIMLLCVHRPEREHRSWQINGAASSKHLERYTHVALRPLTSQQSQQMVESLLDIDNMPAETESTILEKSEGNPFFVEEVIRWMIEHDIIFREGERWKAKAEIRELAVPDTVQSVILARIDRLHEEVKYVLQCASVIGRVFQHRLLSYLSNQGMELEKNLSLLEKSNLVYKEKVLPELEYAFKHALTQETTYHGLLNHQRSAFHERVGDGIETLYQEQIVEYYEQLAYHYTRSSNKEKAINYLIKAGQKAADRYANNEALDYFRRALELSGSDGEYNTILKCRVELYLRLYSGREAVSDYEQLVNSAKHRRDRKEELDSMLGLAFAYYTIALDDPNAVQKSFDLYQQSYSLACELGNKAGMVKALTPTVNFTDYWTEYNPQARENVEEALRLSQEIGDEELIINSKMSKMVIFYQYNLEEMEELGEELFVQLESRHDLVRLKEVCFELMGLHSARGNFSLSIECCDTAIDAAAELGTLPVMYSTRKALALMNLGQYDAAWESLQKEIAGPSHPFGEAYKNHGISIYLRELMAYERASAISKSVISQARSVGRPWLVKNAQNQFAKCQVFAGRQDQANLDEIAQSLADMDIKLPEDLIAEIHFSMGRLEEAMQIIEEQCSELRKEGRRSKYLIFQELKLRISLKLNKPTNALELSDKLIQMAEEMNYAPMLWRIRASKAQALEILGKHDAAAQEYVSAAEIIRKLADTIPEIQLKQSFISSPSVSLIIAKSDNATRGETE